ncbi:MAG: translation elongation factor Ts [Spirochaetaceae bacterium]
MDIKAADVKRLREKTGAGMLDCKKALTETGGDFAEAEKKLKEMGLAAAAKRSNRATEEGRVFTKVGKDRAAVLELACETDFVARNADFIKLGDKLLEVIIEKGLTEVNDELNEMVKDTISTIKENMTLRRFKTLSIGENEMVSEYVHGEGSIGVLVKLKGDSPATLEHEAVKQLAFDTALHIAAFNPLYLDTDSVDEQYRSEQEGIFRTQAKNLDKPEHVLEGIVKGKLKKHFSEICLLEQGFVKEEKKSVAEVVKSVAKEAGGELSIAEFAYYRVGEDSE